VIHVTLRGKESSEELRKSLGIRSVSDVVRRRRLLMFRYVERKEDSAGEKSMQRLHNYGCWDMIS